MYETFSFRYLPIHYYVTFSGNKKLIPTSGGLSQDFDGSGQNRVTAKNQVPAWPSHSAARNITVTKFN